MGSGVFSEPYPPRPDLPMPLVPAGRVVGVIRFGLTALREPAFGTARRQTLWWVSASVVLVMAGQLVVVDALREPITGCGAALATYAAVRVVALTALERRQYAFEPVWLAERSAVLRTAELEVVRCTVAGRGYDLTDPDAVADLLGRQDTDARVVLDLACQPCAGEHARRRLADLELQPVLRPGVPARARFPQARYELRPSGRTTYWLLAGPVTLTVARPAGPATRRGGTGRTGRPDAAHPADGRPPGRT